MGLEEMMLKIKVKRVGNKMVYYDLLLERTEEGRIEVRKFWQYKDFNDDKETPKKGPIGHEAEAFFEAQVKYMGRNNLSKIEMNVTIE